jgi:hypothetical protein
MTAQVTNVEITADTDQGELIKPITAEKTTLTAVVETADKTDDQTKAGKPDVAYQWSKTTDGTTYNNILGATSATYEPTSAEALEGVTAFKVTITGNDVYKVTSDHNSATRSVTWGNGADPSAVSFTVKNETEGHAAATPAPGDVLNIKANIAKAEKTMTYTWTLKDVSKDPAVTVETKTGPSYTVPADAAKGYVLTATAATTGAYTITNPVRMATVQGTITGVVLASAQTVVEGGGYVTEDRVAAPQVGDTLAADVTGSDKSRSTGITRYTNGEKCTDPENVSWGTDTQYQWYADGEPIELLGQGSTFRITSNELGKKISVEVTGGTDFAGAEAVSNESGEVVVLAKTLLERSGRYGQWTNVAEDSQLNTRTTYRARLNVAGPEDLTFSVIDMNDGRVIAEGIDQNGTLQFTLSEKEVGHTIGVMALGTGLAEEEEGDLVWTTDLAVVQ